MIHHHLDRGYDGHCALCTAIKFFLTQLEQIVSILNWFYIGTALTNVIFYLYKKPKNKQINKLKKRTNVYFLKRAFLLLYTSTVAGLIGNAVSSSADGEEDLVVGKELSTTCEDYFGGRFICTCCFWNTTFNAQGANTIGDASIFNIWYGLRCNFWWLLQAPIHDACSQCQNHLLVHLPDKET